MAETVVLLNRCTATKFGYPNDEAWSAIRRTLEIGYGIFEVQGSEWKDELAE